MKNETCKDCQHFIQYYHKYEEGYAKVFCGHCVFPQIKNRKPNVPACINFAKRQQEK